MVLTHLNLIQTWYILQNVTYCMLIYVVISPVLLLCGTFGRVKKINKKMISCQPSVTFVMVKSIQEYEDESIPCCQTAAH